MIYSVWTGRDYTYWRKVGMESTPGDFGEPMPPKHLNRAPSSKIGVAHHDAAWPLPNTPIEYVGRGPQARGMVAARNSALGDSESAYRLDPWTALIVGGLALFWVFRK